MFDLSRLYGSAYSPRSIQWRLIVGICGIRIVRAARSLTRHSRMLGKRLTCLHMRAPTFLALVGAMAPHDLRPIRIVAEVSFLAAAATATARGIPREFVSRGTSSDGMQKVNRSTDSRERQRERQREREREREGGRGRGRGRERERARSGGRSESGTRSWKRERKEEGKGEKKEREARRKTTAQTRVSFTAPGAAPRVIAAANDRGLQRARARARSRDRADVPAHSARSWNTVIARPAYE